MAEICKIMGRMSDTVWTFTERITCVYIKMHGLATYQMLLRRAR
jgi:hypothetical protein